MKFSPLIFAKGYLYLLLLTLPIACRDSSANLPTNTVPTHVANRSRHYLTWSHYDGYHMPEMARYLYDGVELGVGSSGIDRFEKIIRDGDTCTDVQIYPVGYGIKMTRTGFIEYVVPFRERLSDLVSLQREGRLRIYESNFDAKENLIWPAQGEAYEGRILPIAP